MRFATLFFCLFAALPRIASASSRQTGSVADCPELPAGSGLEWMYQASDDFGVCRAMMPDKSSERFMIYLGYAPQFDPPVTAIIDTGLIDGKKIWWFRVEPTDPPDRFREHRGAEMESLLLLHERTETEPALFAHVIVLTGNENQISTSLEILEHLHFAETQWTAWLTPEKLKENLIPRPCEGGPVTPKTQTAPIAGAVETPTRGEDESTDHSLESAMVTGVGGNEKAQSLDCAKPWHNARSDWRD